MKLSLENRLKISYNEIKKSRFLRERLRDFSAAQICRFAPLPRRGAVTVQR